VKSRTRAWLDETHGTGFELVRHFLGRFFDSDLVTEPGQWTRVLVTTFALLLPAFCLVDQVLLQKYRHFSALASAEPYRHAVRGDQLWLITLGMSAVGLLTAVQWQALFPGKRDYFALGTLPIRPKQIFTAKLIALLILVSTVIFVMDALPSVLFPVVSKGRWQIHPSLLKNILAHAASCVAACYFSFFALLGTQGLLLTILPRAWFSRLTNYLQGLAFMVMLALAVLSFSISPVVERLLVRPGVGNWLPPVWFLGLYQAMLGDPDPFFHQLANQAVIGLGAAVLISLTSYLMSYRRHRELAVEGAAASENESQLGGWLLNRVIPDPRQQAVLVFMAKTLARSSQHRTVLMGYLGFSLAILLGGIAEVRAAVKPERVLLASFAYAHMVLLLFLLAGLRNIFTIPVELRANWTFQITEREGRENWLRAVGRLAVIPPILLVVAAPMPVEFALLGWRGVAECLLLTAAYLLLHESLFYEWQKLPFTCSYLPGKENGFVVVLRLLGILSTLPILNLLVVGCLYNRVLYILFTGALLVIWNAVRYSRRLTWSYTPLRYEEEPEPAIRTLKLGLG
jgi:hypothetical protein